MSKRLTVGSLFSGVGGFDIAAERVGMKVLWTSENDKAASKVLEHRFPNTSHLGDIHEITIRQGGAEAPDILVGGFPCQSYSIAGGRRGLAEDRGALWWEFYRLIREGRPTWVVGENVPGLLSSAGGRDFATITRSLVQLGYGVSFRVLDAQWFGVPQRRRRVFIVGHLGGEPRPEVLAIGESLLGHPEPSREAQQVTSAFTASSAGGGGGADDNSAQANHLIGFNHRQDPVSASDMAPTIGVRESSGIAQTYRMRAFGDYADDDTASALKQRDYKDATDLITTPTLMRMREGKPGGGKGPLIREDGSLTIAASSNDQTLFDGPTVRRLTPTETERLQGFPDGWGDVPGSSDASRYRQMGNAVAVPVAEWVLGRIAKFEENNQGETA